MRHHNAARLERARELRRELTDGEKILWARLRRKATGFTFRRQFPCGPYVLDFYCSTANLCVEVDGPDHESRTERDADRDAFLLRFGVKTVRVRSIEVFDNIQGVVDDIVRACQTQSGWKPPGS